MKQPAQKGVGAIIKKVIASIQLPRRKQKEVPQELQQLIDGCTTMDDLLALLFATDFKDEAIIDAFDHRIEQLERSM